MRKEIKVPDFAAVGKTYKIKTTGEMVKVVKADGDTRWSCRTSSVRRRRSSTARKSTARR